MVTLQIENPEEIPDPINDLVGKTFQFLLCLENENVLGGYDTFRVAQVWSANNITEMVLEDSDNYVDPNSIVSGDQVSKHKNCLPSLSLLFIFYIIFVFSFIDRLHS